MGRKSGRWLMILFSLMGLSACMKPVSTFTEVSNPTSDHQKAALVNVELGLGYLAQGEVARAKTKLTHAVKIAPKLPETHSALAYFLERVGEYEDAERAHKRAIALSGKGAVYNNYGAFLCRRDRFTEADKAFQDAVQDKEYARTAEVFENAGICALKAGKQVKANEYLSAALRYDPTRSTAEALLVKNRL